MKTRLSTAGMALSVSLMMVRVLTAQEAGSSPPPQSENGASTQAATVQDILKAAQQEPNSFRVLEKGGDEKRAKEKVVTYYWPVGHEITIGFMGGKAADHKLIQDTAAPWFEHANLTAKYINSAADAEVRIRVLNKMDASYSYLGTTALTIPKEKHTMQLSIYPSSSRQSRAQVARNILHEFGHMLGLLAENTNPNMATTIMIDWPRLYRYAQDQWQFSQAVVDANFRPEAGKAYLYAGKPFDIDSIMMHPIPDQFILKGPRSKPVKAELSPGDKAFLSQIYPRTTPVLAETQAIINATESAPVKQALQISANVIAKIETTKQQAALVDSLTTPAQPQPSITPEKVEERSKQAQQAEEDIVNEYIKLINENPVLAREAAKDLGKLYLAARENTRREENNKAIFGLNDQYSPEVYDMIYKNSSSVGSLRTKGKERLGTGFMIGKDLVLTCNHCLKKTGTLGDFHHPSNLMVDFSNTSNDEQKAFKVEQIVCQGTLDEYEGVALLALDYALLKLGPNKAGKLPSACEIIPLAINGDPAIARDLAVYVVGFPGNNNKTVADNARIFAGFDNNRETKLAYELQAHAEAQLLQKEAEALEVDADTKLEAVKTARLLGNQLIEGFQESFKPGRGDMPRWFMVSSFLSKRVPHAAFALDSDTLHGNSGSPVFSRSSSDVVGVLFRGIDDRLVGVKVGWLRHEEAIPIHVILQNWAKQKPGQAAEFGVNTEF